MCDGRWGQRVSCWPLVVTFLVILHPSRPAPHRQPAARGAPAAGRLRRRAAGHIRSVYSRAMENPSSIDTAIERAIAYDYPEQGTRELDSLIREGFRPQITERLLTLLEAEGDLGRKVNLIGLTWALHASGGGEFERNPEVRPKAYVSHPDEPISANQLRRLVRSATREMDPELFGEYASTIHAIGKFNLLDQEHRALLREFCQQCLDRGFDDAKQRARYILRQLTDLSPP